MMKARTFINLILFGGKSVFLLEESHHRRQNIV